MQWLVKWGVKKWLVGVVNTALKDYAAKVDRARAFLAVAITKVEAVTAFLKSLDAKIADGKITDAEASEAVTDAKQLAARLIEK